MTQDLTQYLYTGPQSSASLRVGDGKLLDVQLLPGKPVELPADHEYTIVLLALKHLMLLPPKVASEAVPAPLPAPEPTATPTQAEKKGGKA
ncbi:hypothetical protein [Pseudomonas sp. J380]|uniref:hypothetical protein n=1 Tax=Pseudomonas sp. J380 TaxID=2605424 RepID=UPI001315EB12|nr:hypothetical protein [Pseudomonas sp. J380]QHA95844.1 hypothetical protein FXO12_03845 [Pseudomonas sp. J380]